MQLGETVYVILVRLKAYMPKLRDHIQRMELSGARIEFTAESGDIQLGLSLLPGRNEVRFIQKCIEPPNV